MTNLEPTSGKNEILAAIYDVIREFNGQLPPDRRLVCAPETVLVGDGGVLDSLGLINLLVLLEDVLSAHVGVRVVLLDELHMSAVDGPFRTVGSLANHVAAQRGSR